MIEAAVDVAHDGLIFTESQSYWYTRGQQAVYFDSPCNTCRFLGSTIHAPKGVIVYINNVRPAVLHEIHTLTWIGSVLLALCGVPQAWRALLHPKSTRSLSWFFLVSWGFGEALLLVGLWSVVSWPVLINYVGNLLLVGYIANVKRTNARHRV